MILSEIPNAVLLPVTMASCLGNALLVNYFSKSISASSRSRFFYSFASSVVSALFLLFYSAFELKFSFYTLYVGVFFGIATAMMAIFMMAAVSIGPLSYTIVIVSSSAVITSLSGLFFGEKITPLKWIGIVLMGICLVLAGLKPKGEEEKGFSLKWLFFSLMAAFSTVAVGFMQKIHQKSSHSDELPLLLFITFVFSAASSVILYLLARKKEDSVLAKCKSSDSRRRIIVITAVCFVTSGIALALNNIINLYLVGVMDSAVFFPIAEGGHLILCTLSGLILFRERLSRNQYIGLICGISATFCLCF